LAVLKQLIKETGTRTLHFNRRFDPPGFSLDQSVSDTLRAAGVDVQDHDANYLHEPWQLRRKQDEPFKVFTPFWRRLLDQYHPPALHSVPRHWPAHPPHPHSEPLESFRVVHSWTKGFAKEWQPGEAGARARLKEFLDEVVDGYAVSRDRPDKHGTSRLSPHLAWGDFNMHVYHHFPDLPTLPRHVGFQHFPFKKDRAGLRAWQRGETGYPLVDAGMRELWQTGWMHNWVRMVVASFLIKHQLIDWRRGEEWFWDTLVDADPAQNAGNWQWVAGCGFDAALSFASSTRHCRVRNSIRPVITSIAGCPS
jgi:deoxyribodipyrimidine photo-lyase